MTAPDPLAVDCPRCGVDAGDRCNPQSFGTHGSRRLKAAVIASRVQAEAARRARTTRGLALVRDALLAAKAQR